MKNIQILIVDDHAIVRDRLRQLLSSQPDMEVAGEAEDGHAALKKVKSLHPDVILLDIAMPRLSGLGIIASFAKRRRKLRLWFCRCMRRKPSSSRFWRRVPWGMS